MMMQGIRNAGKTWLGKVLVALLFSVLIGSFAIWGIGDIFRGQGRNTVATIGKTEIDIEQVRTAYQAEIQRLSRRFRQNITPEMARSEGIDRQILSRLMTEAALDTEAALKGLSVSDAMVREAITEDQNFRNAGGQFDRAVFNEVLRQSGLNETLYVREQRNAIARSQLAEAVSGLATAPVAMQEPVHRYRSEQRVLTTLLLPPSAAGAAPEPTDEQLQTFFNERKAGFRAPEFRTAQTLVLTPATLADPAAIPEADVAAHYETIRMRFGTPERRTVQQVVFPDEAMARAALAQLSDGTSFVDMAKARGISEADLTLGTFTRAEMLDQRVAAAAFELAPDAVSQPVEGAFGFVLVQVTAIEPGKVRPFAEVADTVRTDLALSRAARAISETHDRIEDMRASAQPLAEIAKELKLTLTPFGPIARNGQPAPATPLPSMQQLVAAMFRADIGTDNEAVRTPDNGYIWYDVSSIDTARDRTFEEVRQEVAAQWRQDDMSTRLRAKAREITERVGKGETLAAIAATLGLETQNSPELTRVASLPDYPAAVLTTAFGTPVGGAASADLGGERGRLVFTVLSATVPPFVRTTQEAETIATALSNALSEDLLSQYVASVQARLGVQLNQQNFRNATGGGET